MKKRLTIIILSTIAISFIASLSYLYKKNKKPLIVYETELPINRDIIKETIATGKIVPKEEVIIKPNVSGVIQKIFVEAGDIVKPNQLLAKIRVIPNISTISSAKDRVNEAKINLDNQEKVHDRQQRLFKNGVISANDFDRIKTEYQQALRAYNAAKENYEIIKTGSSSGLGNVANTLVRSTIDGMVLDIPVKVGNQIIEANNFNEGTTIATLADINDMIFEGKIDESEIGKIRNNLPIEIVIGAIQEKKFDAQLTYIAPKGIEEEGSIQFEIKGKLINRDTTFLRAGLSANASIIIDTAMDVLSINEALLQFDENKDPYVEIEVGDQVFEKKKVTLGVSDGIYVEIKEGITLTDKVKIWNIIQEEEENN